jgi:hypothetical protein
MIKKVKCKLTLDQPATYQLIVPGALDDKWSAWDGVLAVIVESDSDDLPITTMTGVFDQAALHGLLRRLYSMGLPLISVVYIGCD